MDKRYIYDFVKLNLTGLWDVKPDTDYHKLINDRGAEGFRLVKIITPPTGVYGTAKYYELIFRKEVE